MYESIVLQWQAVGNGGSLWKLRMNSGRKLGTRWGKNTQLEQGINCLYVSNQRFIGADRFGGVQLFQNTAFACGWHCRIDYILEKESIDLEETWKLIVCCVRKKVKQ